VIDGYWSTLGSFNLDYLSLLVNLELNVAVLDEEFARAMQGSFEADLQHSREVIAGEFAQRTALERAAERVLYRLRKLL
jgi:cardiolipin synthase